VSVVRSPPREGAVRIRKGARRAHKQEAKSLNILEGTLMENTAEFIRITTGAKGFRVTRYTELAEGILIPFETWVSVGEIRLLTRRISNGIEILGFPSENRSDRPWREKSVAPGVYTPTKDGLKAGKHDAQSNTGDEQPDSDKSPLYMLLVAKGVDESTAGSLADSFDGLRIQLPPFEAIYTGICALSANGEFPEVLADLAGCDSVKGVCEVLNLSPESLGPRNGRDGEIVGVVESLAESLFGLIA